ncbi:predicted protein [Naegleria gruberi]|uniref:Predicted protein n=1 Tax=Naegleria gruberi TaxID=5762 RepID=D2V779_NAEGR|nr:uncharacterized protein NAEGRDRAFT_47221 [Naegleria gruberi]EFC47326.1 predicted protein [Naegleria gruberi]|eukprot:XP_002680070.1 predicted protein [Naegleria gruberi strain NEG-M]
MFLSDEIDKAVRGIDDEDEDSKHTRSFVSWRPYNRFYAEGTEELFTNIPTGRSPLVMAAPSADRQTMLKDLDSERKPLPIEYQAMRRSHLKLVGRQLKEFEQDQLKKMSNNQTVENERQETTQSIQQRYLKSSNKAPLIVPKNDYNEPSYVSQDLRIGAYQRYQPLDKKTSVKKQLLKFEGDISERRPDLDYKFELD